MKQKISIHICLLLLAMALFSTAPKAQMFGSPYPTTPPTPTAVSIPTGSINGWAAVTCFSGFLSLGSSTITDGFVFGLINLHGPAPAFGTNWAAPMYHGPASSPWTASTMGQVFGIAIDNQKNVYLAATSSYISNVYLKQANPIYNNLVTAFNAQSLAFGPAGSGGIYKIDKNSGVVTTLISTVPNTIAPSAVLNTSTLPNGNGTSVRPGLGNLTYDGTHNFLFVTNMEDGVIYRINLNPTTPIVDAFYDPQAPANPFPFCQNPAMPPANTSLGFAPLGKRLWGIGYNAKDNRLYYAVWMEDVGSFAGSTSNIIRSIGLTPSGNFKPSSDDKPEILMPIYRTDDLAPSHQTDSFSCPVSDIEFSTTGDMLVGECSIFDNTNRTAHYSRVFKFTGASTSWSRQQIFVGSAIGIGSQFPTNAGAIGVPYLPLQTNGLSISNSSGGVDFGYRGYDTTSRQPLNCDSTLAMNGDILANPSPFGYIYGLQLTPSVGNIDIPNNVQSTGLFVDFNGVGGTQDKFIVADVDIFRDSCGKTAATPNCPPMVSLIAKDTNGKCCWTIMFDNTSPNTYTNLQAHLATSGATFATITSGTGWSTAELTPQSIIQTPTTGPFFPVGNLNLGYFCLNLLPGTSTPPQLAPQLVGYRSQGRSIIHRHQSLGFR